MDIVIENRIKEVLGVSHIHDSEMIQELWSGYGQIIRLATNSDDPSLKSVIVKVINLEKQGNHPRGWNTSFSHQRKVKSYEVESYWYSEVDKMSCSAKMPVCYGSFKEKGSQVLILEDMDLVGFPIRKNSVDEKQFYAGVKWLAQFHAFFMGKSFDGIWSKGTYWHLETRPDEWEVMSEGWLKDHAKDLDEKLHASPFKTVIHGDAKLANFCFSVDGKSVAAVDFQYVGMGCGMQDLAYYVGSCWLEDDARDLEEEILEEYFKTLRFNLSDWKEEELDRLELEWRNLYPVAWGDFTRFLMGWSPSHHKLHGYSLEMVERAKNRWNE